MATLQRIVCLGATIAILLYAIPTLANPRSKSYPLAPETVLTAARSAAGHTIIKLTDSDSQVFSDETQDVQSFAFVTKVAGFSQNVVAIINVAEVRHGTTKLEIFFRRQSTKNVWIPSLEFERRKSKYEYDLQGTLNTIIQ
jgi:hypothetical protein